LSPRTEWSAGFLFFMKLDYLKLNGVVPAVVQDAVTGRVLMVGFMNEEALQRTMKTGHVTFFSRSRNRLWTKGETSGHRLVVKEMMVDCDADSLLLRVEALGPGVCHNGYASCFYRRWDGSAWSETEPRTFDPATVYGEGK
jgi:phosphoribosyl-AMP cyclohydrolase